MMKGSLGCAIAIAVIASWTNTIVATAALKPYDHVADMTQYHSSKLLTTFEHLPDSIHWELETSSKEDEESDKEEDEEKFEDAIKKVEKEKKKIEKEIKKEEKHQALRGHHHHHDDHASEPWDSYPFHPTHFVYKLQEDTESFIADLLDWVHDLVGDVNGSKLNVITQFTVTTTGPCYHPCGDLVAHKTFPVLERFLSDPVQAKLTPHRADKIQWAPSRHCFHHHHSIEVDGGAHAAFEFSCGEQVLLNASVASGGVFGNDNEASGAFVSVNFLNGAIMAIDASGILRSLIGYRKVIPENSNDILKDWTHKVRECVEKQELFVRGVVGGGWRQKYVMLDETSDESIVGYAEAFELTYQPKTDIAPAQIEGPADKTEPPDADDQSPPAETQAPAEETAVPVAETEAPVGETEAPVGVETQAPAEETAAPVAETEAPAETQAPAEETAVPVAETQAPVGETEAPVGVETQAPAEETAAPVAETEAPAETQAPAEGTAAPVTESETPAEEAAAPVAEAEVPAETQAPAEEKPAPVAETEATAETQAPAEETAAPVAETEASVGDTDGPAVETRTPAEETAAPVAETEAPVGDTDGPAVETQAPAEETKAPTAEADAPVGEPDGPALEPVAPAEETAAPVAEAEVPAADTETSSETQAPAADPKIRTTETVAPTAETAVEETDAPADDANVNDAPAAETASPIHDTEPAAETNSDPVSQTEGPEEPHVVGTEAPIETQPPAAELGAPDDPNETAVDEPADETSNPTVATDESTTTSVFQNDVSPTGQDDQDPTPESLYSEEAFHYDENAPEPVVPADLASAKLEELSGATTAAYVHSGMQCRTKTSTSSACFMNTVLAKLGHGRFAMTNKHVQDLSSPPNISFPLFGMVVIICVGAFATFRTTSRRHGYQPISSVV